MWCNQWEKKFHENDDRSVNLIEDSHLYVYSSLYVYSFKEKFPPVCLFSPVLLFRTYEYLNEFLRNIQIPWSSLANSISSSSFSSFITSSWRGVTALGVKGANNLSISSCNRHSVVRLLSSSPFSMQIEVSNLNNYFDFHVCLSIRHSVIPSVCPSSRTPVRTLLSEATPSYVYSILKPHGQNFKSQVTLLLSEEKPSYLYLIWKPHGQSSKR